MMYTQGHGLLKVWNAAEQFLANIPERPSRMDIFNISELLSKEGKMDP
jgi:hypothetical protein